MANTPITKTRYITGFEGIRALSVVSILLYHLNPSIFKGGYLGVSFFFALSGYLITDKLQMEYQKNGRIDFKGFYRRRIRRLYPALFTMLMLASAYILIFQQDLLNNLRGSVVSSLLYYNNWWQIHQGLSYFDRFTSASPFTHIWYLAVEAQNYLVWPIIFVTLTKFVKRKKNVFLIIVLASLASVVAMGFLYSSTDPTRAYYGTDTRIFGIWLGGALAIIWPSSKLTRQLQPAAKNFLNVLGFLALGTLAYAFFNFDDQSSWMYHGGFLLITLLDLVVLAIVAHAGASWNKWLTNPVFKWLDRRSYGIYLYQFPVFIFYEAKVNVGENPLLHGIIEILIVLLCAELSYLLVEKKQNVTSLPLKKRLHYWLGLPLTNPRKIKNMVMVVLTVAVFFQLFTLPTHFTTAKQQQLEDNIAANNKKAAEKLEAAKKKAIEKKAAEQTSASSSTTATSSSTAETTSSSTAPTTPAITLPPADQAIATKYGLTAAQLTKAKTMPLTAVGDSVILNVLGDLTEVFPNILMDGKVGRQLYESAEVFQKLSDDGILQDNVLVSLGSNGAFNENQFAEIMKVIGTTRHVYWINVREPKQEWQNQVNTMLTKMAGKYPNITIVDWYALSKDHDDWFYADQVHPTPAGALLYAKIICQTILK